MLQSWTRRKKYLAACFDNSLFSSKNIFSENYKLQFIIRGEGEKQAEGCR